MTPTPYGWAVQEYKTPSLYGQAHLMVQHLCTFPTELMARSMEHALNLVLTAKEKDTLIVHVEGGYITVENDIYRRFLRKKLVSGPIDDYSLTKSGHDIGIALAYYKKNRQDNGNSI